MILFGNLREFETSTSIIGETLSMKNCVRISNVLITLLKPGLGAGVGWMLEDGEVWMLECGVGWVVVGGGGGRHRHCQNMSGILGISRCTTPC